MTTRLAYVAKDGTPRNVPIAFTWNGSHIVMCTTKNAPKLPWPPSRSIPTLDTDTTSGYRPALSEITAFATTYE
ncbi:MULTISPECIES: hypothetical protein [unclassified Streptomyces]|uniref:hypothetical protein n=1 Tax=Streptomyces sp. Isolate_219 TaxID=2950110 RepID=UPI0021C5B124|nr:hypothetical protein [Streptomyces sp. Isolate_219]